MLFEYITVEMRYSGKVTGLFWLSNFELVDRKQFARDGSLVYSGI